MIQKLTFILSGLTLLLALVMPVRAQDQGSFTLIVPKGMGIEVNPAAVPKAEGIVETIIVNVITIFSAIGGLGVVIYFVWGAVDWILSGGDKEKVANARKKMTHAIIGLVLLSLSYVIINIVGQIVGFNPLGGLQIPGLGYTGKRVINQ